MSQAQSNKPGRTKIFLSDLPTPSFIVNRHSFVSNCAKVRDEARKNGIRRIRPHVKTHKTMEGAYIQAYCKPPPKDYDGSDTCSSFVPAGIDETNKDTTAAQVVGFVASTIPEIELLLNASKKYGRSTTSSTCGSNDPFRDIIYAVPISKAKLVQIDKLLRTSDVPDLNIHVLIDHPAQVEMIERFVSEGNDTIFSAFLKLDTGYHRAGISCDERGVDLADKILSSKAIRLKGLYSHCGHAYDTSDKDKLDDIARADLSMILQFIKDLKQGVSSSGKEEEENMQAIDSLDISVGSTPSLFHHHSMDQLLQSRLEIHPGNYTFYDRQQLWSGAAQDESCLAGRVLTGVIGHYEDRNTLMLDAGATALTKDMAPQGGVCAISGRPDLECYKMSQEVTQVRPSDSSKRLRFADFPLGSIVTLLPNHSCLAAACFYKYYVIDDTSSNFSAEEQVVDEWIPVKGW